MPGKLTKPCSVMLEFINKSNYFAFYGVPDLPGFFQLVFMGTLQYRRVRKGPVHRLPDPGKDGALRFRRLVTDIDDMVIKPAFLEELKDTAEFARKRILRLSWLLLRLLK